MICEYSGECNWLGHRTLEIRRDTSVRSTACVCKPPQLLIHSTIFWHPHENICALSNDRLFMCTPKQHKKKKCSRSAGVALLPTCAHTQRLMYDPYNSPTRSDKRRCDKHWLTSGFETTCWRVVPPAPPIQPVVSYPPAGGFIPPSRWFYVLKNNDRKGDLLYDRLIISPS